MSSLDNLLTEVGPILASSQFTHPSFREVLVAKQFAEEINSGKLSIMDAYVRIISAGGSWIIPNFRPVVNHMVELLREEKALELVEWASHIAVFFSKSDLTKFRKSSVGYFDWIVEDLVICAEFIGRHRWADAEGHNRAKDVIDILGEVYNECTPKWSSDEHGPIYELYQRAFHGLNQAKSSYANRHLNVRLNAMITSSAMLSSDPDRIKEFSRSTVRNLGVDRPLEALLEGLCIFTGDGLPEFTSGYLRTILEVIKEGGFKKEHIQQFNEEIERLQNGAEFIKVYRFALKEFAKDLKNSGAEIYDVLEKNKTHFWDYWMVYKPK